MNKQGQGKIDWTDYTWNPVTGCLRDCWYCYVKRLRDYDRRPTFHPDRLDEPLSLKKSSKIFVCSTGDLFAEWNQDSWIEKILRVIEKCPQHTFQFLTKSPEGYRGWKLPDNCWFGVTETGKTNNLDNFTEEQYSPTIKFISFEPLLEGIKQNIPVDIQWIIIGAMTGARSYKYHPRITWIESLIAQADSMDIPVFMKDNLRGVWPHILRKEFPKIKT